MRERGAQAVEGGFGAAVLCPSKQGREAGGEMAWAHHGLSPLGRAGRCEAPVGEDMAGTCAGRGQFSGCCKRSKTELRELNSSCKREQLGT